MKKLLSLVMCVGILVCSVCGVKADESIKVYVDGYQIETDQPPVIVDGRTLLPLRVVAEAMGCEVNWDEKEKQIKLYKDSTLNWMLFTIGNKKYEFPRGFDFMDVAPTVINGRTMLPIRYIAEWYHYDVNWNSTEKIIDIINPAKSIGDSRYYGPEDSNDEIVGNYYISYDIDFGGSRTQRAEFYISKIEGNKYKVIEKEVTVNADNSSSIGEHSINEYVGYFDNESQTLKTEFVQEIYDDYGVDHLPDVLQFKDGNLIHMGIAEQYNCSGVLERF